MVIKKTYIVLFVFFLLVKSVSAQTIEVGAEQKDMYLEILRGKKIGVTANHTSLVGSQHLVDMLLENGINVQRIFAPEHGFRGQADAGEHVNAERDAKTGIEIASIYGNNRKPTVSQLREIDCMIFDMQDVGVRFFTYVSTMHYVMEACAEQGIPVVVLDRPNPNGFYIDGPVLELKHRSFVGMHAIPVVHAMTLGELALMINKEGWLKDAKQCKLTVVPCKNYTHKSLYTLQVKPSPNLPDMQSVYLYPSLCFFEGTEISVGRGTDYPFQIFGHPNYKNIYTFSFTPESREGAKNPPLLNRLCYGVDLRNYPKNTLVEQGRIRIEWLVEAYRNYSQKDRFFTPYMANLWGTESVQKQIEQNLSIDKIRASWSEGITRFKQLRKKYLLYPDFE